MQVVAYFPHILRAIQQSELWHLKQGSALSVHMVALTCTASLDLLTTTIGSTSAASPFALQRNAIKIHLATWRDRMSNLVIVCICLYNFSFVGLSLSQVPGSRAWPAFNAARAFSAAVLKIYEWLQYMLSTNDARSAPTCCGKRKASLNRTTSSATLYSIVI